VLELKSESRNLRTESHDLKCQVAHLYREWRTPLMKVNRRAQSEGSDVRLLGHGGFRESVGSFRHRPATE